MASKPNPTSLPIPKALLQPSQIYPKHKPETISTQSPTNTVKTTSTPSDKKRCFRCQGLAHFASKCPNKRVVTLAEYQASCEELEEENDEGEKELLMTKALEEVEEGPDE